MVRLILVSDCESLVNSVLGRSAAKGSIVQELQWFVYFLRLKLGVRPICEGGQIICHQKREFNALADATVSWLLDSMRSDFYWACEAPLDLHPGVQLQVSSDGGFRKTDGGSEAASACIVQLHDEQARETRIVAIWAERCSAADSYAAEAYGLVLACRLVTLRGAQQWSE
jgi:hypothetical protein